MLALEAGWYTVRCCGLNAPMLDWMKVRYMPSFEHITLVFPERFRYDSVCLHSETRTAGASEVNVVSEGGLAACRTDGVEAVMQATGDLPGHTKHVGETNFLEPGVRELGVTLEPDAALHSVLIR